MYPRASSTQEKKPVAKDENVRKESELEESLISVQPAGNEAANVELMDQMLKDANNDNNILDLSSSYNIVNDNNIICNDTGSDISDESDLNIISTSSKPRKKKKPSKDDEKKALNMAEKVIQGQAPGDNNDFAPFPPTLLTRIWLLKTAAKRAQKRRKKAKNRPNSKISSTLSPNQR